MRPLFPTNRLLLVDRDEFRLTLFKRVPRHSHMRILLTFPIAVGAVGHHTPRGAYCIQERSHCPDWKMPNSDWVPEAERGRVIPCGDPANPIRERWLGLWPEEGIGIHGTLDDDSIGSRASHGCIRMHVADIRELYPQVPKNTTCVVV